MKVGAIVQARMGSTRLPGKVLRDIAGTPMLGRVIDRTRAARAVHSVIVATTTRAEDDPLAAYAAAQSTEVYRGEEEDVLDRYYQAARAHQLDVVVRITSDCPLLDPEVIDQVVQPLLDRTSGVEFSANTLDRTFPRGLDVEAVPIATLERLWRSARLPHYRAHVFPFIYEHRDQFSTVSITAGADFSRMRWTVDTEEDLLFVRTVCQALGPGDFTWRDIVRLLEQEPEWLRINETVRQKSAHE